MEAPEKIYLYPSDRCGEEYEAEWGDKPWGEDYVEYTRTDALIEKACEWLLNNLSNYSTNALGAEYLIEDLKKYMKGE